MAELTKQTANRRAAQIIGAIILLILLAALFYALSKPPKLANQIKNTGNTPQPPPPEYTPKPPVTTPSGKTEMYDVTKWKTGDAIYYDGAAKYYENADGTKPKTTYLTGNDKHWGTFIGKRPNGALEISTYGDEISVYIFPTTNTNVYALQ